MKRILSAILYVAICCFDCVAQEYDVFLLVGQSNMAGRGWMIEGDEQVFDENVYILNAEGVPVPAANPLNQYSSIRKDMSMQQICPGYGFSIKLSRESGRKILLVVNARGGTVINQWMKGAEDGYYDEMIRRTKQAMQYGQLKAVLWHQGCGDAGRSDTYMDSLAVFVSDMRGDLGLEVPFIAGELGRWRPRVVEFNQMLHSISEHIPNSDYISSEGCMPIVTERSEDEPDMKDPHFDRASQILIGERYAEKVLMMCY